MAALAVVAAKLAALFTGLALFSSASIASIVFSGIAPFGSSGIALFGSSSPNRMAIFPPVLGRVGTRKRAF